jgi:1-aminocyclopropane-1-carboxylate deaminase
MPSRQESWVPHEDAVYDRVGNIMLSRITSRRQAGFDIGIRRSLERVKAKGGKHYAIPAGASGDAVGFSKDGRAPRVIGIDASATPKQTKAQGLDTQTAPALLQIGACSATEPPE